MSRYVIINDLVVTERRVEIPDTCPKCQADLTEEWSLIEGNLTDRKYCAEITQNGTINIGDEIEEHDDTYYVVGYFCENCNEVLADSTVKENPLTLRADMDISL